MFHIKIWFKSTSSIPVTEHKPYNSFSFFSPKLHHGREVTGGGKFVNMSRGSNHEPMKSPQFNFETQTPQIKLDN